jgi:hypothetical protein
MKTVISETHTKATASLQEQIDAELHETKLEVSIASLLEKTKEEEKEKAKNENTPRND